MSRSRFFQRYVAFGVFAVIALAFRVPLGWAQESYSVEPAALRPSADLPHSLAEGLDPQGSLLYTESNGLKEPICEIFLARTVSAESAPAGKLRYGQLRLGALIGVIHLLPEATEDYYEDLHEQKLKPGFYTMRYAVMKSGTSASGPEVGELVILSPASKDSDPQRVLPMAELIRQGRLVSGTELPAGMELAAAGSGSRDSPTVSTSERGVGTFQVKLHLASGQNVAAQELAFAVIVLTPSPHPAGS